MECYGNDSRNKPVLRVRLNKSTDGAILMLTGSAFHAVGPAAPATTKERSPNLVCVRGMSSRWRDDDLRPARRAVLDTGTQQFMM